MNRTIIILIILGSCLNLKSQENNDHLEPVQSIYSIYDFQFEYYSKVRKILFNGLSDSPVVRFQVLPSFSPEYVVDIEHNRETEAYFVIYHKCKKSIWYNNKRKDMKVEKHQTEISKESALKFKELFKAAILKTKFPTNEVVGLDGANYYFSYEEYGLKSGTIWSPSEGTNMSKLIETAHQLIEIAKSKKSNYKLSKSEIENIDKLIIEIKSER